MSSTIEVNPRHKSPTQPDSHGAAESHGTQPHQPPTPHLPGPPAGGTPKRPQRNMRRLRAERKAAVKASTEGLAVNRRWQNVSWWAVGWLTAAHLVVLAAPFYFTWSALVVALVLHWITGSLGICLGYHRLLTHDGMKTHPWVRYLFATIGSLAGEGTPLDWTADHRKHHKHSDQIGDPHSPHEGPWWSHMFWLAFHTHNGDRIAHLKKWVPDLYRDRGIRVMDYLFLPLHIASGFILYGLGYAYGGADVAASWVIWGLFVRLVAVLHTTWLVNSASHMFGYRNYETTDDSRNNWLVAIIAYGEGWHNNHHAYPRMAMHGHKWWEFDITWVAIRVLQKLGLVWDVVDYRNAAEKAEKAKLKSAAEA